MGDSKGLVDDANDGLKSVIGKLGEFFHIFDLSFFVAGAVSFGAMCLLFIQLNLQILFPFPPWVAGLSLVIACYVCGLICFALGRPINRKLFRRNVLNRVLRNAIDIHQLQSPVYSKYLGADDKELWRLYIRLWQQLVAKHARTVAFSHLLRYWAMAAIFDSLGVALLLWAAVIGGLGCYGFLPISGLQTFVASLLILGAAFAAFYQGGKYYEYQIEDLVAALAVEAESLDHSREAWPL